MISTSVPTTTGNVTVVSMSATSGNPVHSSEENVVTVQFLHNLIYELMTKKQCSGEFLFFRSLREKQQVYGA